MERVQWIEECEEAFWDSKCYLISLPILSSPKPGKDLYMYSVVFDHAVSAILLKTQEGYRGQCIISARPW